MRSIFLKGKAACLGVLTEDDALSSNWYNWFNDEETTLHLQKHYYPNTVEAQVEFFRSVQKDRSRILLGVFPVSDLNDLIGVVSLDNINYINSNASVSLVVGNKEYKGLKYAEESMRLILRHAFNSLNLNKVQVGYIDTLKQWGLFLKKRFGFVTEGVLKRHVFKNGIYRDTELLGLFKDDFLKNDKNKRNAK